MMMNRELRQLRRADSVRLSPVLLDVLVTSGLPLRELVLEVLVNGGFFEVRSGSSTCDRLLTSLPLGSGIGSYRNHLDLALPTETDGGREYCEADGLPFMTRAGELPDRRAVSGMPGRNLSQVAATSFASLRRIDPMIETAAVMRRPGGDTLDLVFDISWITIPLKIGRRH